MPALAHVVPLTPVEGVYTYRVPDELATDAVPGARVLVSFGRRALTGVIVKRDDGRAPPARKLKPLLDVLDARPALTPELLEAIELYMSSGAGAEVLADPSIQAALADPDFRELLADSDSRQWLVTTVKQQAKEAS